MNIAIIGIGNVGSGLARVLGETEHKVIVVDRDGGEVAASKLKAEGGDVQGMDITAAVRNADIVILSTFYDAVVDIAKQADFTGKTVIDVSNPVTADFSALQLGHNSSAAEEIAKLMPGATVVKAFNTIFAQHYATGLKIGNQKLQTFIASDDESALETVKRLAEEIGLEAHNAGPLSNSRYLEPMGFMNIQFGYVLGKGAEIAPQWLSAA